MTMSESHLSYLTTLQNLRCTVSNLGWQHCLIKRKLARVMRTYVNITIPSDKETSVKRPIFLVKEFFPKAVLTSGNLHASIIAVPELDVARSCYTFVAEKEPIKETESEQNLRELKERHARELVAAEREVMLEKRFDEFLACLANDELIMLQDMISGRLA